LGSFNFFKWARGDIYEQRDERKMCSFFITRKRKKKRGQLIKQTCVPFKIKEGENRKKIKKEKCS